MRLGKLLAVTGLGVSSWLLTAASLKLVDLTLVVGVFLLPNPGTQLLGSILFGTLLVNYAFGLFGSKSPAYLL